MSKTKNLDAIELHNLYLYIYNLMKLAIHIFTFYMFALSLAPCGDGGNGIVEIAKHFFGVEHQHISDHDQHSNGCGVRLFVFVAAVRWH